MKYIFGVLGSIAVLLLVFVFVINRGNDGPSPTTKKPAQLVEYADKNSNVSLTTVGSVVGVEEHRSIRIVVSADERRLEVLGGYDEQIISSQTFSNTKSAYETFLSAISGQGFLISKETKIKDQRSVCPTGNRYLYELNENSQPVTSLWSVSCDKTGTFNGKAASVRNLFELQIPDYEDLTSTVEL